MEAEKVGAETVLSRMPLHLVLIRSNRFQLSSSQTSPFFRLSGVKLALSLPNGSEIRACPELVERDIATIDARHL